MMRLSQINNYEYLLIRAVILSNISKLNKVVNILDKIASFLVCNIHILINESTLSNPSFYTCSTNIHICNYFHFQVHFHYLLNSAKLYILYTLRII